MPLNPKLSWHTHYQLWPVDVEGRLIWFGYVERRLIPKTLRWRYGGERWEYRLPTEQKPSGAPRVPRGR